MMFGKFSLNRLFHQGCFKDTEYRAYDGGSVFWMAFHAGCGLAILQRDDILIQIEDLIQINVFRAQQNEMLSLCMRSAFTKDDLPEYLGLSEQVVKEQGQGRTHQNVFLRVTLRIWTYPKWIRRSNFHVLRSTAMGDSCKMIPSILGGGRWGFRDEETWGIMEAEG